LEERKLQVALLQLCDLNNCFAPARQTLLPALQQREAVCFAFYKSMAKSKQAKAARKQEEKVQQPTPPAYEGSEEGSDVEFVTEAELEKDEAEEELERLVFGDSEGFREGLRDFKLDDDEAEEDGNDSDASGLEGMDDADVSHSLHMRSFLTLN
jgi:U3 small nucleolar RNA-associated protein 18